jgi:hypothetical protein
MNEILYIPDQSFHLVPTYFISFCVFVFLHFFPIPTTTTTGMLHLGLKFLKKSFGKNRKKCSSINCHGNWYYILLTIYSDWEGFPALKRNMKGNVMNWLPTAEFTKLPLFVPYCYFQSLCFKGFRLLLRVWNLSVQNITMS